MHSNVLHNNLNQVIPKTKEKNYNSLQYTLIIKVHFFHIVL